MIDYSDSPYIIAFFVGLLAVVLACRLIKLPVELLSKFVSNSVVGALMLLVVNACGIELEITIIKALLCGITGIPGVICLVAYETLMK